MFGGRGFPQGKEPGPGLADIRSACEERHLSNPPPIPPSTSTIGLQFTPQNGIHRSVSIDLLGAMSAEVKLQCTVLAL